MVFISLPLGRSSATLGGGICGGKKCTTSVLFMSFMGISWHTSTAMMDSSALVSKHRQATLSRLTNFNCDCDATLPEARAFDSCARTISNRMVLELWLSMRYSRNRLWALSSA
jgi:hypothetical protein